MFGFAYTSLIAKEKRRRKRKKDKCEEEFVHKRCPIRLNMKICSLDGKESTTVGIATVHLKI